MSEHVAQIRKESITSGHVECLPFLRRYYAQLGKADFSAVIMDRELLWKRFCKINGVLRRTVCWSHQNITSLNEMSDSELYFSILKAFGLLVKEML